MKFIPTEPPRSFHPLPELTLQDCGTLQLQPTEQVTLETPCGVRHDVTAHPWGYYVSNSLNHRLQQAGMKTALVVSLVEPNAPRLFINLVLENQMDTFLAYLEAHQAKVVNWLDEWLEPTTKRTDID